ncbi:Ig-like domain-containing protein [Rhodococcus gannanensis]|uniref:Ig-like domain-containing protein n=1 Tax=Rhodococcus gannanensis TaxID=1960308 RepID=A0ABW4P5H1_9NOCA
MRLSLPRRFATPLIAASAAAGLVLGVTNGVAAADPPASSRSLQDAQILLTKEVVGSNVVYPGDSVTYKTTLGYTTANGAGNAPLNQLSIAYVREVPPAGWVNTAKSLSYAGGGGSWSTQDGGQKVTCSSGCTFLVGGYVIKSGQSAVLTTTYTVPANTPPGIYDSGAWSAQPNTWSGGERGSNTFGVFVQVADPNVATTTDLQAPATAKTGESVTLTANVGPANAVGTVQFKDGNANIGGPVAVSGGVATLAHTFDTLGAHPITAAFTAGAGFHSSVSGVKTVDVTADTTTSLNAPATAVVGDDVTFTATVTPAGATGQVQFKDGAADLGAPVDVVNGSATLTRKFVEAGSHNVTANFVGTGGYANSASAPSSLTVTDADFGTTITVVDPTTAVVGTPVNLSATVFPIPSGGDVVFRVDGDVVGTAPVGTGDGVAVLPHTFTSAGSANVTAEFTGAAGFTPSTSAGFTVSVSNPDNRTATSTGLVVAGGGVVGQTATFTATVDPANADGTVQFKVGNTDIGGPVAVVNGVATLTHTFDAEGTYAVTAEFVGGSAFKNSVSGPTVIGVGPAGTGGGTGSADLGSVTGLFGQ